MLDKKLARLRAEMAEVKADANLAQETLLKIARGEVVEALPEERRAIFLELYNQGIKSLAELDARMELVEVVFKSLESSKD